MKSFLRNFYFTLLSLLDFKRALLMDWRTLSDTLSGVFLIRGIYLGVEIVLTGPFDKLYGLEENEHDNSRLGLTRIESSALSDSHVWKVL